MITTPYTMNNLLYILFELPPVYRQFTFAQHAYFKYYVQYAIIVLRFWAWLLLSIYFRSVHVLLLLYICKRIMTYTGIKSGFFPVQRLSPLVWTMCYVLI